MYSRPPSSQTSSSRHPSLPLAFSAAWPRLSTLTGESADSPVKAGASFLSSTSVRIDRGCVRAVLNLTPVSLLLPSRFQYDESNDGDPYVCFRRREAKPVRKTRRTDSQSVDRLASLQQELQKAQQLASDTLARERRKADQVAAEREAWEAKMRLIDVKRKYPALGLKPDEEELLFRTVIGVGKRQKMEPPVASASSGRDERVVKASRKSAAGRESVSGVGSPAPGLENRERRELAGHPSIEALRDRTLRIAAQIEQDIMTKREGDYQWEDHTDVSFFALYRLYFGQLSTPLLTTSLSNAHTGRLPTLSSASLSAVVPTAPSRTVVSTSFQSD